MVDPNASNLVRENLQRLMKEGHEAGNESVIEEIVAPDFVLNCPDGSRKTRSESAQTYAAMRRALTSYTITCDLMVAEDHMLAARTAMHGKFTNPFPLAEGNQIEAHGGPVHFETISIYRFDSQGRLTEEWAQSDNMTLFSQLGLKM